MSIDKGKLYHWWRLSRKIKLGPLFGLLILFGTGSIFWLRQNNLGMVARREKVIQADKKNGHIEASLRDLQGYVTSHMNTKMANPIYLQHSYERDYKSQLEVAAKTEDAPNSDSYKKAQIECRQSNTVSYAECVIKRTSHLDPGSDPITRVEPPQKDLYRYIFYSPAWSPDLAGFAVLGLILTLLILLARIIFERVLHIIIKK